jgi:hypothetical protein
MVFAPACNTIGTSETSLHDVLTSGTAYNSAIIGK